MSDRAVPWVEGLTIGQVLRETASRYGSRDAVVFPDAALKFFLDASPQERARRRIVQLRARGEIVEQGEVLHEIIARDERDRNRPVGPLRPPQGAEIIDTTSLSEADVIERIVYRARQFQQQATEAGRKA